MKNVDLFRARGSAEFSIIVHSHLRWDFVWQRPQQILSRLAQDHPVLFVEEPMDADVEEAALDIRYPYANVIRVVPQLPKAQAVDYDHSAQMVLALLQEQLRTNATLARLFKQRVLWFYTPMPVPHMLGQFEEIGVVYDCMDELAQFKGAPPDLRRREQLLLKHADVVFTGGRNLYEAKSRAHSNVHFFGCGVDVNHFGAARKPETDIPDDLKIFSAPIAGYFGVIDERLDYGLLARLAQAKPQWTFVMVGPVVKVDVHELPQAANIKWMGQRDYKDLPGYVKAFDVCLMPFSLNAATQYINPTKTLEYMAAGKPILSTAVADVIKNFTPVVQVVHSPDEFVQRLEATRQLPQEILDAGLGMASKASWETIVFKIRQLIRKAVLCKTGSSAGVSTARPAWK